MQLSSLALTVVLTFAGSQIGASQNDAAVIRNCRVTLIDDLQVPADLPAQESGVLTSLELQRPLLNRDGTARLDENGRQLYQKVPRLSAGGVPLKDPQGQPLYKNVFEGMSVRAGDVLGQVDTRMASKQRDVAAAQLKVAVLEADNQVSVDYATKGSLVAEYEYLQAEKTNLDAPGAIAAVEVTRLLLTSDQSLLQIEQAKHELAIAKISVTVRQAQLALAEQEVERRTIKAPIDGVIQEILPQVGEWLRPGEPVMRIVGMRQLRVKGDVDANRLQPYQLQGRDVKIEVLGEDGRAVDTFQGKIVFVSQLIETGSRFEVWADVENRQPREGFWSLRPGMNATMIIRGE